MQARKLLLTLALIFTGAVQAQTAAKGLAGDWSGALEAGGAKLRLVLHVTRSTDGVYLGKIDSLDQGSVIPFDQATVDGSNVKIEWNAINATYTATLSADGSKLDGTWSQGMPLPLVLTRTAGAAAVAAAQPAAEPWPFDPPIDVQVPFPPIAVTGGGGRSILGYELYIVNFRGQEVLINKIEVRAGTEIVASLEGTELTAVLKGRGQSDTQDSRQVGASQFRTAWMWVTLAPGATVPNRLMHRITVDGETVEIQVPIIAEKPIVIGPPLTGGVWLAANGPGNNSIHRRAILPSGGRALIAQRFAIDWIKLDAENKNLHGDPLDNKSYNAYGAPVIAVADATVVAVKDGIVENVPGENSRAVKITMETVGGNHVVLDLGGGRYGFYAHLQPGSLRVKAGDRVKRGQVLGLLGNSGNSTEPHLHFHVMNGPSPLGSEGLPYVIDSWESLGGQNPGKRQNAMPMQNARVIFPE